MLGKRTRWGPAGECGHVKKPPPGQGDGAGSIKIRTGGKRQCDFFLSDDPPQLSCPCIKRLAFLLNPVARGEIVNLVGDRWQRFAVLILAHLMIEAKARCVSDRLSSPHIVAAVRRRLCGVNDASPSNSQMPGVRVTRLPFFVVLVPVSVPDIA